MLFFEIILLPLKTPSLMWRIITLASSTAEILSPPCGEKMAALVPVLYPEKSLGDGERAFEVICLGRPLAIFVPVYYGKIVYIGDAFNGI